MPRFTDLHMHPSMKPYGCEGHADEAYGVLNSNPWLPNQEINYRAKPHRKLGRIAWGVIKNTVRFSQTSLGQFEGANLPGGIAVLHPVERGWFDYKEKEHRYRTPGHETRKWLLEKFLPKSSYKFLAATMSGIPTDKISSIIDRVEQGKGVNYFREELHPEYDFLVRWSGQTGPDGRSLKLVANYTEWKAIADAWQTGDRSTVALILAIEGGHALTNIPRAKYLRLPYAAMPRLEREALHAETLANVTRLKGRRPAGSPVDVPHSDKIFHPDHTPLYVTLAHFFHNFLCGHAKTFRGGSARIPRPQWPFGSDKQDPLLAPGMDDLLHQEVGMDTGITDLGWDVIQALLSRDNGKRVLIDVKHMSAAARREFYDWLAAEGPRDEVPILFSHGGVSGEAELPSSGSDSRERDKGTYFSRWSINATDRDVVAVIASGGLFGLAPHEGRLPGGDTRSTWKKLRKKFEKRGLGSAADKTLREAYARMLWSNLIRVRLAWERHAGENDGLRAWQHVTMGSDYDGMMDPFDTYLTVSEWGTMYENMLTYMDKVMQGQADVVTDALGKNRIRGEQVARFFVGTDTATVLRSFFFDNLNAFLRRYFNDDYRLRGQSPIA